jgi:hypothetical protein
MKLITILLMGTLLLITACSSTNYDTFAQCLTDEGATMFGAYWCSHCEEQKKTFGDSFQYIDYVECSLPGGQGQTQVCEQAGIEGYPTWEFADGSRRSGQIPLQDLSQLTGCPIEDA